MGPTGPPHIAMLLGEGSVVLGEVAVAAPAPGTAIALSAGRFPKAGPVVDANEDAVMIATDGRATLAAVADGHFGFDAARAAITALHAGAAALLDRCGDDSSRLADRAYGAAVAAIATELTRADGPRAASRTALTVAAGASGALTVATAGDTAAIRVRGGRARRFGGTAAYLGPNSDERAHRPRTARLRDGDYVVVLSDGAANYIGRSWPRRVANFADGTPPVHVVRRVVEAAFAGGAGDHVAVAAFTPPGDIVPPSRQGQW